MILNFGREAASCGFTTMVLSECSMLFLVSARVARRKSLPAASDLVREGMPWTVLAFVPRALIR